MTKDFKHISNHQVLQNLTIIETPVVVERYRFYSAAVDQFIGRGTDNDVICELLRIQSISNRKDGWATIKADKLAERIVKSRRTVYRSTKRLEAHSWFRSAKLHTNTLNKHGFPNMVKSYYIDIPKFISAVSAKVGKDLARELHKQCSRMLKYSNALFKSAVASCDKTIESLIKVANMTGRAISNTCSYNSNINIEKKVSALPCVVAAVPFLNPKEQENSKYVKENLNNWLENGFDLEKIWREWEPSPT